MSEFLFTGRGGSRIKNRLFSFSAARAAQTGAGARRAARKRVVEPARLGARGPQPSTVGRSLAIIITDRKSPDPEGPKAHMFS